MKIVSVNIPIKIAEADGLKQIRMRIHSDVVVLSGKNGSGKTRIMKMIHKEFLKNPTVEIAKNLKNSRENLAISVKTSERFVE